MAVELKSLGAWRRALEEGGWDEEGVKRKTVLGERNTRLAIFALPTLVFGVVFMTLAGLPWYTGRVAGRGRVFRDASCRDARPAQQVLVHRQRQHDAVLCGHHRGSVVWVCYAWVTRLVGVSGALSACLLRVLAVFAGFFGGTWGAGAAVRRCSLVGRCVDVEGWSGVGLPLRCGMVGRASASASGACIGGGWCGLRVWFFAMWGGSGSRSGSKVAGRERSDGESGWCCAGVRWYEAGGTRDSTAVE
ncbi:hypothetical protein B0H14DRAFT_1003174 [Mycena olivaceomarginata]|nr:hypothetical protein B0H14DRAFT_1003174 [Mycena olivaceomarginata]